MRLQNKIRSILLPLIIAPILFLGVTAYLTLKNTSEQAILVEMQTKMGQLKTQIETTLLTAEANIELFSKSDILEQYLRADNDWQRYFLMQPPLIRQFGSYQSAYPNYQEIRVLLPNGSEDTRFAAADLKNSTEDESAAEFFRAIKSSDKERASFFFLNPDTAQVDLFVVKKLRLRELEQDPNLENKSLRLFGYLVLTISLDEIDSSLSRNRIGENGYLFLTDADGTILFHTDKEQKHSQLQPPLFEQFLSAIKLGEPAIATLGGSNSVLQASFLTDNLLLFAVLPEAEMLQASRNLGKTVVSVSLFAVIITIGMLGSYLKFIFVKPVEKLVAATEQIGGGNLTPEINIHCNDEIGQIANALREMGGNLQQSNQLILASLAEKEILLREIHHRVKNNMAVISSMLRLQARNSDSASVAAELAEAQNRIEAMALIHETIYRSDDFGSVILEDYIHQLVSNLTNIFSVKQQNPIKYHIDTAGITLNLSQAVTLGLILNELLTNALKHAFPNREGKIQVQVAESSADALKVSVIDDGIGIQGPDNIEMLKSSGTIGMRLVSLLVEQLSGELKLNSSNKGTTVEFTFPCTLEMDVANGN